MFRFLLLSWCIISASAQDWKPILVPGEWESQIGDYDGFAWYRCSVEVPETWRGSRLLLSVRAIDAVDEAYFNGEKVGSNGGMPPLYAKPSSDVRRPAVIDPDLVRFGERNLIAFRIYDESGVGGILQGPIQLGRLNDAIDLSGTWEFVRGDQKEYATWAGTVPRTDYENPAGHLGVVPADKAGRDEDMALVRQRFEGNRNVHSNIDGKGTPRSPQDALAALTVHEDFILETVLSEPTITQPLYVEFDERGRMWVTEYIQYPQPAGLEVLTWDNHLRSVYDAVPPPPPYDSPEHRKFIGRDRISIHEDTNGDGTYDSHKLFLDGLNMATSTCQGDGGVWVMNPPYLLFYPDENGDDLPDKAPDVHLSGFGLEDTHSIANSLKWGPDGWLYGCTGSTVTARVKVTVKPHLAPLAFFGQAIWRYHPHRHDFELFAEGGWNTFGVDFDSEGRLYSGTNGGMQAVYFVQGGFYQKSFGKHGPHTNPNAFDYFDGIPIEGQQPRLVNQWVPYGGGAFPGHAGHFFGVNCLANEIAILNVTPDGSGFLSTVLAPAITSEDVWFRPVHATTGPEGALYVSDFYDARITHVDPRDNWDRIHGRVYRLRHRQGTHYPITRLDELDDDSLIASLDHPNQWNRWTARRLLVERAHPGTLPTLRTNLTLERLWTLHQLNGLDETTALAAFASPDIHVRLWTIRLLGDGRQALSPALYEVVHSLARSLDPLLVSQLAASLQRFPTYQALPILAQVLLAESFTNDPYIPSQLWWALETHLSSKPDEVLAWLRGTPLWHTPIMETKLGHHIARGLASDPSPSNLDRVASLIEMIPPTLLTPIIQGIEDGLQGITLTSIPPRLDSALAKVTSLNPNSMDVLRFGLSLHSASAREIAIHQLRDPAVPTDIRLQLVTALNTPPTETLFAIATDDDSVTLRRAAIHALRSATEADIPQRVLALNDDELQTSILTLLAGRASWSMALLDSLETGTMAISALTIDQRHMIQSHGDPTLTARLERLTNKPPPVLKQTLIDTTRQVLAEATGNPGEGKAIFATLCASCHQLFGEGATLGPDLTGYDRSDRDFLLTAIIDPNLALREEYELTTVTVRPNAPSSEPTILSGFVRSLTSTQLTLQDIAGNTTTLATRDILKQENSPVSLMPEGLLQSLTPSQLRDLFAYLQRK